jgi:hypothetical protein
VPACRFSLWSYHPHFGDAIAFVGVGMLDEGERLLPEVHYFTRSEHPWVALLSDLPASTNSAIWGRPGAAPASQLRLRPRAQVERDRSRAPAARAAQLNPLDVLVL